jgi:hypothetical protein
MDGCSWEEAGCGSKGKVTCHVVSRKGNVDLCHHETPVHTRFGDYSRN